MVIKLLTDPNKFFALRADSYALLGPILVVALAGIGAVFPSIAVLLSLNSLPALELSEALIVSGLLAFFQIVVLWVAFGIIAALLAQFVDGRITTWDALAAMGWGFLPLAVAGVVRAFGRYFALRTATQPKFGTMGGNGASLGMTVAMRVVREYLAQASDDPIYIGSVIIALACIAWTGYLWIVGIEYFGEDFDRRDAAIVGGLPAVAYAVLFVVGIAS